MIQKIDNNKLTELLQQIGNPQEPARSYELLTAMKAWLTNPLITLTDEQRSAIEDALQKHGML